MAIILLYRGKRVFWKIFFTFFFTHKSCLSHKAKMDFFYPGGPAKKRQKTRAFFFSTQVPFRVFLCGRPKWPPVDRHLLSETYPLFCYFWVLFGTFSVFCRIFFVIFGIEIGCLRNRSEKGSQKTGVFYRMSKYRWAVVFEDFAFFNDFLEIL